MWTDTWHNGKWSTDVLRVPKNPTEKEIKLVVELCKNRILKLERSINHFTCMIDNYRQMMEAEEHDRRTTQIIFELRTFYGNCIKIQR